MERTDTEYPQGTDYAQATTPGSQVTIDLLISESHGNSKAKGWWDPEMVAADHPYMVERFLDIMDICMDVEEYRKTGQPVYINRPPGSNRERAPTYSAKQLFLVKLLLVVTEVVEAAESYIEGHTFDEIYEKEGGKTEGIAAELADVAIRIGDACGYWGIPLAEAIVRKAAFNRTRPFRHGKKV